MGSKINKNKLKLIHGGKNENDKRIKENIFLNSNLYKNKNKIFEKIFNKFLDSKFNGM